MFNNIIKYILFAGTYLVTDLLWISFMSDFFYRGRIERVQKQPMVFRKMPAVFAYMMLTMTLFLICQPLSLVYERYFKPKNFTQKCLLGGVSYALVGGAIYSIYNLTNLAIFANYDVQMAIVDTVWGVCSFGVFGMVSKVFVFAEQESVLLIQV